MLFTRGLAADLHDMKLLYLKRSRHDVIAEKQSFKKSIIRLSCINRLNYTKLFNRIILNKVLVQPRQVYLNSVFKKAAVAVVHGRAVDASPSNTQLAFFFNLICADRSEISLATAVDYLINRPATLSNTAVLGVASIKPALNARVNGTKRLVAYSYKLAKYGLRYLQKRWFIKNAKKFNRLHGGAK